MTRAPGPHRWLKPHIFAFLLAFVWALAIYVPALVLAHMPVPPHEVQQRVQAAPPSPAPVPPNASRITATVRKYSVRAFGGSPHTIPPVPSDRTLYSLLVEIQTSEPANPAQDSLARPGLVIETFSGEVLGPDLIGKQIEALLKLTGDTRGVHWWISNVHVLP